ncbi:MAG: cell-cell signaling protein [Legionellales bacterium]|nr:cell-cell signaling protein [Legionellales bacterium]|tara:strand:+ start:779 stop:1528 length:750 start_codon:yes stop_codon:yes gene_type:complete
MDNALIIGASGDIGIRMTQLLLEKGIHVIASVRDHNLNKSEYLNTLKSDYKSQLILVSMDISAQESVEKAFSFISGHTNKLNLIINCTGLLHNNKGLQPEKRLEDINTDNLVQSFTVNSIGPLLIARYALPLLRHNDRSVLSNISARIGSISDNRAGGWYAYRAAKAAQNMITKTLAIELNRRSPNTICVGLHPGTVNTKLSKPFQRNLKLGQLTTAKQSVNYLYKVITKLEKKDSGKIFAWDGSEISP